MTVAIEWRQHAYTVGELRRRLADFPDDLPVIMARDAEGNGYSPCGGIWPAHYEVDSPYSGEVKDTEDDWNPDDYDTATYEEYLGDAVPVVLLGPVN